MKEMIKKIYNDITNKMHQWHDSLVEIYNVHFLNHIIIHKRNMPSKNFLSGGNNVSFKKTHLLSLLISLVGKV